MPLTFPEFIGAVRPDLDCTSFHRIYYDLLDRFAHGRLRRLMVTLPPQHGKSTGASLLLPAYLLGLDPDLSVAIASYSTSYAARFNRGVQRLVASRAYAALYPATRIKRPGERSQWVRTAQEAEIVDRRGVLYATGRGGPLTGRTVDVAVLDDLYKNAMEASSPLIREHCWDWYTSVVRTRLHNASRELLVFTRWHEEDLIGRIASCEPTCTFRSWSDLEGLDPRAWVHLHWEALKTGPATPLDPRPPGRALWPEQYSEELLEARRRLDPLRFECLYQGHPAPVEGLLYAGGFAEYDHLPAGSCYRGNYTDTADTGDDYLCSVCFAAASDGLLYIVDMVYSRQPMEATEQEVAGMLLRTSTREAWIESNNGGRGFARALQRLTGPRVRIRWFHQSANKEARILTYAPTLLSALRFPRGWRQRWPELAAHLLGYRRRFRSNRWHDAPDALTGIVERAPAAGGSLRLGNG